MKLLKEIILNGIANLIFKSYTKKYYHFLKTTGIYTIEAFVKSFSHFLRQFSFRFCFVLSKAKTQYFKKIISQFNYSNEQIRSSLGDPCSRFSEYISWGGIR